MNATHGKRKRLLSPVGENASFSAEVKEVNPTASDIAATRMISL